MTVLFVEQAALVLLAAIGVSVIMVSAAWLCMRLIKRATEMIRSDTDDGD